MTNQHPITPPPELVRQWWADAQVNLSPNTLCWVNHVAAAAARWGADQELEACCGFIGCEHSVAWSSKLRAARRPKPPSLKAQALAALEDDDIDVYLIRRALEALPND
jgi:hypothetical protein